MSLSSQSDLSKYSIKKEFWIWTVSSLLFFCYGKKDKLYNKQNSTEQKSGNSGIDPQKISKKNKCRCVKGGYWGI